MDKKAFWAERMGVTVVYCNPVGAAYYDADICKYAFSIDKCFDDGGHFVLAVSFGNDVSNEYVMVRKGGWQGKPYNNWIVSSAVADPRADDGAFCRLVSGGICAGCEKCSEG